MHDSAVGIATPEGRAARVLGRLDELFEIGRDRGTNRIGLAPGEQQAYETLPAGCASGARRHVRRGRQPRRAPGRKRARATRRSGAARTSTRRPMAGASTARSACSLRSTPPRRSRPTGSRAGRSPSWPSGSRKARASAAGASAAGPSAEISTTTRAPSSTPTASRSPRRSPRSATASFRRRAGSIRRPRASSSFTSSRARRSQRSAAPLGLVTSIAGMAGFEIIFTGARGHAGTVQMALRRDALGAAARFVVDAHDVARSLAGRRRDDRQPDRRCPVRPTRSPSAVRCSPICVRPTAIGSTRSSPASSQRPVRPPRPGAATS